MQSKSQPILYECWRRNYIGLGQNKSSEYEFIFKYVSPPPLWISHCLIELKQFHGHINVFFISNEQKRVTIVLSMSTEIVNTESCTDVLLNYLQAL